MLHFAFKTLSIFTELVFPKFCCGCNKIGAFLCHKCYEKINFLTLPPPVTNIEYLDQVIAAAEFSFPINTLLKTLKYKSVQAIGVTCGRLLYYSVVIPEVDVITAVPLHPKRQQQRRFNQSEMIACELAQLIKKTYVPLLQRSKNTPQLASIADKDLRLKAITDSFTMHHQKKAHSYKTALIVDDVVTSGSTINECAKVLKNNGFSRVIGMAVAHGS